MPRLKAAVVGCGGAGTINHLPWYAWHDDVELVGAVDVDLARAEWCAGRWGGRAYQSLGEMLAAERPDLVSIATPVHFHAEQTVEALRAGCHVLCEKPMARTLAECDEMIDAAARQQVMLGVALDKRFSPLFQRAHELIRAGEIGTLRFVRVHWTVSIDWGAGSFRSKRMTGGGVFEDVGSHFVDLCAWLMGSPIRALSARDVAYVHINDAPAGVPFDEHQDLVRETPGRSGVIDLVGFLAALRDMGYGGPVEPSVVGCPELDAMPAPEAARILCEALTELFCEAGIPV
jgi:predicted dehydrogenase